MTRNRPTILGLMLAVTAGILAPAPAAMAETPVIVVGAGDIADCASSGDSQTAALLDGIDGTVLTFGDNAYENGTATDFSACYGPTWGRHRARTHPAIGNHEYQSRFAIGYYDYFGSLAGPRGRGYYAFTRGTWRIIVLNSNCTVVSCKPGSAQILWLQHELAAHASANVLAYWHHPRFSSGEHGSDASVATFWDALYAAGADVIINGHDHDYERFAPQNPAGKIDDAHGIRQFVVGTGGRSLRAKGIGAPNSQLFSSTYGVIKLQLKADSFVWRFIPVAGQTFTDRGTGLTHGPP